MLTILTEIPHFYVFGGKFYSLHVKHNLRDLDQGLDNVDHHLLDKYIFKPILGINDYEEENSKMNFVKGNSD